MHVDGVEFRDVLVCSLPETDADSNDESRPTALLLVLEASTNAAVPPSPSTNPSLALLQATAAVHRASQQLVDSADDDEQAALPAAPGALASTAVYRQLVFESTAECVMSYMAGGTPDDLGILLRGINSYFRHSDQTLVDIAREVSALDPDAGNETDPALDPDLEDFVLVDPAGGDDGLAHLATAAFDLGSLPQAVSKMMELSAPAELGDAGRAPLNVYTALRKGPLGVLLGALPFRQFKVLLMRFVISKISLESPSFDAQTFAHDQMTVRQAFALLEVLRLYAPEWQFALLKSILYTVGVVLKPLPPAVLASSPGRALFRLEQLDITAVTISTSLLFKHYHLGVILLSRIRLESAALRAAIGEPEEDLVARVADDSPLFSLLYRHVYRPYLVDGSTKDIDKPLKCLFADPTLLPLIPAPLRARFAKSMPEASAGNETPGSSTAPSTPHSPALSSAPGTPSSVSSAASASAASVSASGALTAPLGFGEVSDDSLAAPGAGEASTTAGGSGAGASVSASSGLGLDDESQLERLRDLELQFLADLVSTFDARNDAKRFKFFRKKSQRLNLLLLLIPQVQMEAFVCKLMDVPAPITGAHVGALTDEGARKIASILDMIIELKRAAGARLEADLILLRGMFLRLTLPEEVDPSRTNLVELMRAIINAVTHSGLLDSLPCLVEWLSRISSMVGAPSFDWTPLDLSELCDEMDKQFTYIIESVVPELGEQWSKIQDMEFDPGTTHSLIASGGFWRDMPPDSRHLEPLLENLLSLRLLVSATVVELHRRQSQFLESFSHVRRLRQLTGFQIVTNTVAALGFVTDDVDVFGDDTLAELMQQIWRERQVLRAQDKGSLDLAVNFAETGTNLKKIKTRKGMLLRALSRFAADPHDPSSLDELLQIRDAWSRAADQALTIKETLEMVRDEKAEWHDELSLTRADLNARIADYHALIESLDRDVVNLNARLALATVHGFRAAVLDHLESLVLAAGSETAAEPLLELMQATEALLDEATAFSTVDAAASSSSGLSRTSSGIGRASASTSASLLRSSFESEVARRTRSFMARTRLQRSVSAEARLAQTATASSTRPSESESRATRMRRSLLTVDVGARAVDSDDDPDDSGGGVSGGGGGGSGRSGPRGAIMSPLRTMMDAEDAASAVVPESSYAASPSPFAATWFRAGDSGVSDWFNLTRFGVSKAATLDAFRLVRALKTLTTLAPLRALGGAPSALSAFRNNVKAFTFAFVMYAQFMGVGGTLAFARESRALWLSGGRGAELAESIHPDLFGFCAEYFARIEVLRALSWRWWKGFSCVRVSARVERARAELAAVHADVQALEVQRGSTHEALGELKFFLSSSFTFAAEESDAAASQFRARIKDIVATVLPVLVLAAPSLTGSYRAPLATHDTRQVQLAERAAWLKMQFAAIDTSPQAADALFASRETVLKALSESVPVLAGLVAEDDADIAALRRLRFYLEGLATTFANPDESLDSALEDALSVYARRVAVDEELLREPAWPLASPALSGEWGVGGALDAWGETTPSSLLDDARSALVRALDGILAKHDNATATPLVRSQILLSLLNPLEAYVLNAGSLSVAHQLALLKAVLDGVASVVEALSDSKRFALKFGSLYPILLKIRHIVSTVYVSVWRDWRYADELGEGLGRDMCTRPVAPHEPTPAVTTLQLMRSLVLEAHELIMLKRSVAQIQTALLPLKHMFPGGAGASGSGGGDDGGSTSSSNPTTPVASGEAGLAEAAAHNRALVAQVENLVAHLRPPNVVVVEAEAEGSMLAGFNELYDVIVRVNELAGALVSRPSDPAADEYFNLLVVCLANIRDNFEEYVDDTRRMIRSYAALRLPRYRASLKCATLGARLIRRSFALMIVPLGGLSSSAPSSPSKPPPGSPRRGPETDASMGTGLDSPRRRSHGVLASLASFSLSPTKLVDLRGLAGVFDPAPRFVVHESLRYKVAPEAPGVEFAVAQLASLLEAGLAGEAGLDGHGWQEMLLGGGIVPYEVFRISNGLDADAVLVSPLPRGVALTRMLEVDPFCLAGLEMEAFGVVLTNALLANHGAAGPPNYVVSFSDGVRVGSGSPYDGLGLSLIPTNVADALVDPIVRVYSGDGSCVQAVASFDLVFVLPHMRRPLAETTLMSLAALPTELFVGAWLKALQDSPCASGMDTSVDIADGSGCGGEAGEAGWSAESGPGHGVFTDAKLHAMGLPLKLVKGTPVLMYRRLKAIQAVAEEVLAGDREQVTGEELLTTMYPLLGRVYSAALDAGEDEACRAFDDAAGYSELNFAAAVTGASLALESARALPEQWADDGEDFGDGAGPVLWRRNMVASDYELDRVQDVERAAEDLMGEVTFSDLAVGPGAASREAAYWEWVKTNRAMRRLSLRQTRSIDGDEVVRLANDRRYAGLREIFLDGNAEVRLGAVQALLRPPVHATPNRVLVRELAVSGESGRFELVLNDGSHFEFSTTPDSALLEWSDLVELVRALVRVRDAEGLGFVLGEMALVAGSRADLEAFVNTRVSTSSRAVAATALLMAVEAQDLALVTLLLEHGANVDDVDSEQSRRSALHLACLHAGPELVAELLAWGANPRSVDVNGKSPLHYSAEYDRASVVPLLLLYDAWRGRSEGGWPTRVAEVEAALEAVSVVPNRETGSGSLRYECYVARSEGCDASEALARQQAYTDMAEATDVRCALHYACSSGVVDSERCELVALLLGAGADPDVSNPDGWTALHWAARAGRAPVVQALLDAGANASAATLQGRTPLDEAVEFGHSRVVRLLLTGRDDGSEGEPEAVIDPLVRLARPSCSHALVSVRERALACVRVGGLLEASKAHSSAVVCYQAGAALVGIMAEGGDAPADVLREYVVSRAKAAESTALRERAVMSGDSVRDWLVRLRNELVESSDIEEYSAGLREFLSVLVASWVESGGEPPVMDVVVRGDVARGEAGAGATLELGVLVADESEEAVAYASALLEGIRGQIAASGECVGVLGAELALESGRSGVGCAGVRTDVGVATVKGALEAVKRAEKRGIGVAELVLHLRSSKAVYVVGGSDGKFVNLTSELRTALEKHLSSSSMWKLSLGTKPRVRVAQSAMACAIGCVVPPGGGDSWQNVWRVPRLVVDALAVYHGVTSEAQHFRSQLAELAAGGAVAGETAEQWKEYFVTASRWATAAAAGRADARVTDWLGERARNWVDTAMAWLANGELQGSEVATFVAEPWRGMTVGIIDLEPIVAFPRAGVMAEIARGSSGATSMHALGLSARAVAEAYASGDFSGARSLAKFVRPFGQSSLWEASMGVLLVLLASSTGQWSRALEAHAECIACLDAMDALMKRASTASLALRAQVEAVCALVCRSAGDAAASEAAGLRMADAVARQNCSSSSSLLVLPSAVAARCTRREVFECVAQYASGMPPICRRAMDRVWGGEADAEVSSEASGRRLFPVGHALAEV
ncbi:uncharacterized protein AMSG_01189 [Thecamonas trahens ATCC 50062]|uniref:Uncharacterized protein n=1 Tax=Thecamonas trahens ATCC 50062 TaxID=461836 RepID=A0A0L0DMH3_THETB|nr:hypothetical protein AMSG_01189 [Thecamonas trahens ATCC 50062]KNC53475.1 hypothetical protein AMSG_01189 [Thecamonas trahens ATCC 50062]|eukprot:XP_013761799.1 hypothetical protein AMSG_01189 [Thecamonas trahens ATCC 50062]